MAKIHFMNLSDKTIAALMQIASVKRYSINAPLHYQGQVPIVAYLIIHGSILLLKNSKIYHRLSAGCLVGYRELSLNKPSAFTAKILSDTEICYIDKSTLFEIKNSEKLEIKQLYSELLGIAV